jgi:hypothetical protein
MCGEYAETNEHVLCLCSAKQCTYAKGKVATMMAQNIQCIGGDNVTQNMMATIYGTTGTDAAVDRQVEYDESDDMATVKMHRRAIAMHTNTKGRKHQRSSL